ncbi:MAG: hypothetical protein ACOZAO_04330 [Patescibacteria group bacterium]
MWRKILKLLKIEAILERNNAKKATFRAEVTVPANMSSQDLALLKYIMEALAPKPDDITIDEIIEHLNDKRKLFKGQQMRHWYSHAIACPVCRAMGEAMSRFVPESSRPAGRMTFDAGADLLIAQLELAKAKNS